MDTCLPMQDPHVQYKPDLLDPKGSPFPFSCFLCLSHTLSPFLFLTLWHTLTYTQTTLILKGHKREKERNGSCHFSSFNWGSAAVSVTEPLRGGHQTKEKPFTLYCLLPQRAHISFPTLSSFFFSFFYTSLIFLSFIFFPLSLSHCTSLSVSIFYKVWRFDNALWAFPACQKYREGKKGKGRESRDTLQSRRETFWAGEERDGCLPRI